MIILSSTAKSFADGSSQLGVWRPDREVETTGWELFDTDPMTGTSGGIAGGWERERVQFELSNHLGNIK